LSRAVSQYPSIPYLTALADILDVQLQQTISRLTDECWDKCVSSPSTYFSGKENACLDNCAKRFMDTTQFVIKYYNSKNARGGGGEGFDEFA
jgi:import inner membrane translocase subunit TIM8